MAAIPHNHSPSPAIVLLRAAASLRFFFGSPPPSASTSPLRPRLPTHPFVASAVAADPPDENLPASKSSLISPPAKSTTAAISFDFELYSDFAFLISRLWPSPILDLRPSPPAAISARPETRLRLALELHPSNSARCSDQPKLSSTSPPRLDHPSIIHLVVELLPVIISSELLHPTTTSLPSSYLPRHFNLTNSSRLIPLSCSDQLPFDHYRLYTLPLIMSSYSSSITFCCFTIVAPANCGCLVLLLL